MFWFKHNVSLNVGLRKRWAPAVREPIEAVNSKGVAERYDGLATQAAGLSHNA